MKPTKTHIAFLLGGAAICSLVLEGEKYIAPGTSLFFLGTLLFFSAWQTVAAKKMSDKLASLALALLLGSLLGNWYSWKDIKPEGFAWESVKHTSEECAAGTAYLKIINNHDTNTATLSSSPMAAIAKLIETPHWYFDGKDTDLYTYKIGDLKNTTHPLYNIPVGCQRSLYDNNIAEAKNNVEKGKLYEAAERIAIQMAVGNHLVEFPEIVAFSAGNTFYNMALDVVTENPSLAKFPRVAEEMKRAGRFPELRTIAQAAEAREQRLVLQNKICTSKDVLPKMVLSSNALLTIERNSLNKLPYLEQSRKIKGELLLQGQPLGCMLSDICVPLNLGHDAENAAKESKRLLNMESPGTKYPSAYEKSLEIVRN